MKTFQNLRFNKSCELSNLAEKSTESLKKTKKTYIGLLIGICLPWFLYLIYFFWSIDPTMLASYGGVFAALVPIYIDGIQKINRELRRREEL